MTGGASVIAALRSVMRFESGLDRAVQPIRLVDEEAFVASVERHRVAPVIAPYTAELDLPKASCASIRSLAAHSQLAGMRTAASTVQVSDVLTTGGVPHLLLKGAALAFQTTGSPAARGGGDVDVLVAPEAIPEAVRLLQAHGIEQDLAFAPPPESPLFPAVLRTQQELVLWHQGTEVDLHWRLDCSSGCLTWPFGMLDAEAESVPIGATEVRTLSRAHAAIFNASNATRDAWSRLRAVVDHHRLMEGLDAEEIGAEAWRCGSGRRFDMAQVLVSRLVGTAEPAADRFTMLLADRVLRWLGSDLEPSKRRGARAAARLSGANYLTHDSFRNAAARTGSWTWPVRAMAARDLGEPGDRFPWLYPLASPYFVPRRAMERAGVVEAVR